ncbi:hypothetical protein HaLaN_12001, partial [Haematococcus lacustris]
LLLSRLEEGEPERDLAAGIAVQGSRLQELVYKMQATEQPRQLPSGLGHHHL